MSGGGRPVFAGLGLALFATLVVACTESGPRGDPGPPGTDAEDNPASLKSCVGGPLYLGHESTLVVSGDDTTFDATAELDVTGSVVHEITLASPTALVARVTPDLASEPGLADVTVRGADGDLSLVAAIEVRPSLELARVQGSIANASQILVDVVAPDERFPLAPDALSLDIEGATGVHWDLVSATAYTAQFRVFTDMDATAGSGSLVLTSGEGDQAIANRAPAAIAFEPRVPTVLDVEAMPAAVEGPAPFESHLYSLGSPRVALEVTLDLTTASPSGGGARLVVLSPEGTWEELVGFGTSVSFIAFGDPFLVLVVGEGVEPYTYDLVATAAPAPNAEAEPNDACGQGDVVQTFPTTLLATLEGETAEDWFRVDVGALDAGKRLRARTQAGNIDTDTEVAVLDADCTTVVAGPVDNDYHENLLTPPLPEGTYFVRVRPSQVFPSNGSLYKMTFSVE